MSLKPTAPRAMHSLYSLSTEYSEIAMLADAIAAINARRIPVVTWFPLAETLTRQFGPLKGHKIGVLPKEATVATIHGTPAILAFFLQVVFPSLSFRALLIQSLHHS